MASCHAGMVPVMSIFMLLIIAISEAFYKVRYDIGCNRRFFDKHCIMLHNIA